MQLMDKVKFYIFGATLMFSSIASANFYVDYQGISKDEPKGKENRGIPDGYRLLVDKSFGVVHQIGRKKTINIDSFGVEMHLKDAISMIMPEEWVAYIDENIEDPKQVDWQAEDENWIGVLARVGINHGYKFIVDWDQKLLQIYSDEDYIEPDYDSPITLKDPESKRTLFIYSSKPKKTGGYILVDGKVIPIASE